MTKEEDNGTTQGIRLQKWLAEAGLCSRRQGEQWIVAGRVTVNGQVVQQLGTRVVPGDKVAVDGRSVAGETQSGSAVLAFNKPVGVLCSRKDPQGRKTIFDLMGEAGNGLISVGRLDLNSEGLLLLTKDGQLVHQLTHPSRQVARIYRARVRGRLDEAMMERIRAGVALDDGHTGPLEVALDRVPEGSNSWVTITLREGRNRLVRRIFEFFGMEVSRLIRISYGGVTLGEMPTAHWRILERWEANLLRQAAGMDIIPGVYREKRKRHAEEEG
ncbi:MAG: rRNA pseudouridine synthase [Magnetococcales bacterium]|nr:rRNA pseudouridine synthase [Magnetococcales bacterium]NGZ26616.1 rRNA pseudouridine synthase [Magnetococcales bacterium]